MTNFLFKNLYYSPNCTLPLFGCFYICLPDKEEYENGITYDEAVFYAIDEGSDFCANDGEWIEYTSDEDNDSVIMMY